MKRIHPVAVAIFAVITVNSCAENTLGSKASSELIALYEEERVAYELYDTFAQKYNIRPFENIRSSESQHRAMMKRLLTDYDIPVPENTEKGKFDDPRLQKIHDQLAAQGRKSLVDALQAATLVEEMDIADLNKTAENASTQKIKKTCGKLIAASENHLRAFVRNLEKRNVGYTPQVLTQQTYDAIIGAELSKGKSRGKKGENCRKNRGKGRGNGTGR